MTESTYIELHALVGYWITRNMDFPLLIKWIGFTYNNYYLQYSFSFLGNILNEFSEIMRGSFLIITVDFNRYIMKEIEILD